MKMAMGLCVRWVVCVVGLGFTLGGCAGIYQQGVAKDSVGAIHGHNVEIGFFPPDENGGTYALLERVGSTWQLKALDGSRPEVSTGQELLFIRSFQSGAVEVSPVYENTVVARNSWMECDVADKAYTACNSALVIDVPLNAKARKLDREAIASALREARVLETMDNNEASAADVRRRGKNVQLRIAKVENIPRLVPLSNDEAKHFFGLEVERGSAADSLSVRVYGAHPLLWRLPTATVNCSGYVANNRQEIRQVSPTEPATVEVTATVETCDVESPHPVEFVATEKGGPLTIRLVSFDPRGQSTVTLSNSSNHYVKVSPLSLYYFDKIISSEAMIELAPAAESTVSVRTLFATTARFEKVTASDAPSKAFTFGVAAKYTTGDGPSKTLLDVRQIALSSVLPSPAPN